MNSNGVVMAEVLPPFEELLESELDCVDEVERVDGNDYYIRFNCPTTWDVYREVIVLAARNMKVVTEYEFIRDNTIRFAIYQKDAIKVRD